MKKIIYGESNFRKVKITNEYFYIDKTQHIEMIEAINESFLIFLRPRRFGKSLFLSTLQYYYDENSAHEFDAIFQDTYIGQNPTALKSSFRIFFLEFSGINVDGGMEVILEGVTRNISSSIYRYFKDYGYEEHIEKLDNILTPDGLLKYFFQIVKEDDVYLLIDEYDQFANAILAYSMKDFLDIVGKGGFVRSFYEVIKTATYTGTVRKMFITGVTPITLDSLSSGFNIVSNISHKREFNALAGFTQNEVNYSLEESLFQRCNNLKKDELLLKVKTWYNGYLFNLKANQRIYNATLVNYFISNFDYIDCTMPTKMLDSNVASDYKAIMKLFNIGNSENNYTILKKLIEEGTVTGRIKDRYDLNRKFDEEDFITLLYSMGFITIKDELFGEMYEFGIPNYVIKMLYFNYFAKELEQRNSLEISSNLMNILVDLALGDSEPFENRLNKTIETLSNRDHYGFDEKHFQSIVLALLSFAEFYFIESQPEKNNKYPDILLVGRDEKVPNNYLFELKWAKAKDNYKILKKKGIEQVTGYLALDKIKAIPKLRSFVVIGSKDGVEFVEV
jgi:hypothetical protein